MLFFDTSVLLKGYIAEQGSDRVAELSDSDAPIFIARITAAEIVAALSRKAKAEPRHGTHIRAARNAFRSDYASGVFRIVELEAPVIDMAMDVAEKHGLRGYDAVQLATALTTNKARAALGAGELTFVCADSELSDAAEAEGLAVERV